MQTYKVKAICLAIIIMIFMTPLAMGQDANTIMYQGRLTDSDGNPISTPVSVLFSIGTAPDGSSVILYDTTMTVTPDENGVFTVELGPLSTTVLDGSKRYLGLNVGGDGEMLPRQLLTSAPASHTAARTSHEPGIAYKASLPAAVFRDLSESVFAMDSISIEVPSSGFIHVTATTSLAFGHILGITDQISLSISETKSIIPGNFGLITQIIPSGMPTGIFIEPVLIQRVFTVPAAGTYKFYVNSQFITGYNADDKFYNLEITACYYPANYGTVSNPSITGANGIDSK